jgi:uncharacterized protein DUF5658
MGRWMRITALSASIAAIPSTAHAQSVDPEVLDAPALSASLTVPAPVAPSARRAALLPLYGSLIGLQALDLESTIKAIGSGAGRESNPMLQSVVGRPAALLAVKAGASGLIIFASERLRKEKHPAAAVVLMIGINSAYAIVVAHNYALAHSSR